MTYVCQTCGFSGTGGMMKDHFLIAHRVPASQCQSKKSPDGTFQVGQYKFVARSVHLAPTTKQEQSKKERK